MHCWGGTVIVCQAQGGLFSLHVCFFIPTYYFHDSFLIPQEGRWLLQLVVFLTLDAAVSPRPHHQSIDSLWISCYGSNAYCHLVTCGLNKKGNECPNLPLKTMGTVRETILWVRAQWEVYMSIWSIGDSSNSVPLIKEIFGNFFGNFFQLVVMVRSKICSRSLTCSEVGLLEDDWSLGD